MKRVQSITLFVLIILFVLACNFGNPQSSGNSVFTPTINIYTPSPSFTPNPTLTITLISSSTPFQQIRYKIETSNFPNWKAAGCQIYPANMMLSKDVQGYVLSDSCVPIEFPESYPLGIDFTGTDFELSEPVIPNLSAPVIACDIIDSNSIICNPPIDSKSGDMGYFGIGLGIDPQWGHRFLVFQYKITDYIPPTNTPLPTPTNEPKDDDGNGGNGNSGNENPCEPWPECNDDGGNE